MYYELLNIDGACRCGNVNNYHYRGRN